MVSLKPVHLAVNVHGVGAGECVTWQIASACDVREELLPRPSLGGAAHDAGDVHEGHGGQGCAGSRRSPRACSGAGYRQGHDATRLMVAKWVVRGEHRSRGSGVEQVDLPTLSSPAPIVRDTPLILMVAGGGATRHVTPSRARAHCANSTGASCKKSPKVIVTSSDLLTFTPRHSSA